MSEHLSEARAAYESFTDGFRSVVLATVDADGNPCASYAPCVVDSDRTIWCLVSGLSSHTPNVEATGKASAFFVEDESSAAQIFARKRLTYDCDAAILPRDHQEFDRVAKAFVERFGEMAGHIASMPDFRPLRLTPKQGQFVIGFGKAYTVEGGELKHLTGGGKGHGHSGGGVHGHGGHPHAHGGGHGHAHGHAHGEGHGDAHGSAGEGLTPEAVQAIVGHMNGDHADSVLHYARSLGGAKDANRAVLVGLDEQGMDLSVTTGAGTSPLRIAFPKPIRSRAEARELLITLARSGAGAASG
jgi:hypothetical protein